MLGEMQATEILEWQVFLPEEEKKEFEIQNIRFGTIASWIVNLFGLKEGQERTTWKDFFSTSDAENAEPEKPQSWKAQLGMAHVLKAIFGGRITQGKYKKKNGVVNNGTGSGN